MIMIKELTILNNRQHDMVEVLLSLVHASREPLPAMLLHPASQHLIHLLNCPLHLCSISSHCVQPAKEGDCIRNHKYPRKIYQIAKGLPELS